MTNPTVREKNPLTASQPRLFVLERTEDETGISGTGIVAEGVEFSNGMCAMCWLTSMHSVAVYPNLRQLEAIHGHNGRTKVRYVEPPMHVTGCVENRNIGIDPKFLFNPKE